MISVFHARSSCPAVLTEGRNHQVRPTDYYSLDKGYAPWLTCLNCNNVLWGLYTIREEEEPW